MTKYLSKLIVLFFIVSCGANYDSTEIKPSLSNITESVYASVKVSPTISYNSQPIKPGVIERIFVQEGDTVKKDDILFQIMPNTNANSQLVNANINLEEARSKYLGENSLLNNLKLEIALTKEQFDLDSINLRRQERLLSQNIGKKVEFDQLKLKYESSKKQLELLQQKLRQTELSLKNDYKKALNNSKTGKDELDDFVVRSKIDGKVYSLTKEEGDFITAQDKFAEIGSYEDFKIEMNIDEVDITKIEIGDSVLILLDAYPEKVFLASISKIFPKKNDVSQTFKVESEFIEQPPKLYYGLSGEANIIVSTRKNTLTIPTEYLLPNNRVLTNDGEKMVMVGMKNLEFVEILSGVDSATVLIRPSN